MSLREDTFEVGWGLVNFSDLEHRVLDVDAFSFTALAEVKIITLAAKVPDSDDWFTIAVVAAVAVVHLVFLRLHFLGQILLIQ